MQITIFRDYIKWESSEKQGFLSHTLMTLMKLKLNMTDEELAERFKVETYVVNMTLRLWIPALHKALYGTCENLYRYQRFFSMETFTKVIDIVEVCVERPECKSDSRDSRHEIRRAVMAIRADGYFCFGSNVFSQYVPEDECIRRSKFWRSTTDVDIVLTHPEFLQVLISKGVACLSTNSTATERFELATERIAAFKILGAIPLEYASYTSFIFKVCGALSNFKHSIPDDEDDEE
ncbi:hypothetical protein GE061_011479 [Apolygus lucorum]|nr:hypothetical protein GE061_011479 [Apolygus lucorum]